MKASTGSKTRSTEDEEAKRDITALAIEGDLEGIKHRVEKGQSVNFRNKASECILNSNNSS